MSQDFSVFMGDVLTMVTTIVDPPFFLGLMAVFVATGLSIRMLRLAFAIFNPPELEPEPEPEPRYSPIIVPSYAPRRDPNHPRRD